jgi:D-threonine aldolase
MTNTSDWFSLTNIDEVDSPALVVYEDRVKENIKRLVNSIDDVTRLRPHVKTHKSSEVTKMMLEAGIKKFKCATIAEAEMLAQSGAQDILLAYQPIGPKVLRLVELTRLYPETKLSCLIDNYASASFISQIFQQDQKSIQVYIDLNVGMNRTGIGPADAFTLYEKCKALTGIKIVGLHAYDGHIRDEDYEARRKRSDDAFAHVTSLRDKIKDEFKQDLIIVAGGTPTYSIHSKRKVIECSPGTYVYWDKGYEQALREQNYLFAALVITRIISKPAENIICVDLGHKSIASENILSNRVFFLNAPDLEPIGHSEEHMVLKTKNDTEYNVGDVLYGVPYHICPTVALHDRVAAVENNKAISYWTTLARNRTITV